MPNGLAGAGTKVRIQVPSSLPPGSKMEVEVEVDISATLGAGSGNVPDVSGVQRGYTQAGVPCPQAPPVRLHGDFCHPIDSGLYSLLCYKTGS